MKGEKMPKCERCNSESDDLRNWGQLGMICHNCIKDVYDDFPEKPKRKRADINIEEPKHYSAGSYWPNTSIIVLRDLAQFCLEETINHEMTHYVIHKLEGLQTTYQFDNIAWKIDPYHGLS